MTIITTEEGWERYDRARSLATVRLLEVLFSGGDVDKAYDSIESAVIWRLIMSCQLQPNRDFVDKLIEETDAR